MKENNFKNLKLNKQKRKGIRLSKKTAIFLLSILIIFHCINNFIILKNNVAPMHSDSAHEFHSSIDIYSKIQRNEFKEAFNYKEYRPTFFFFLPIPFYKIFGLSQTTAVMVNTILLIILIFSIYGIGKILHSRKVGLLSAFIVTSFPHVFGLSRSFLSDYALMSTITLSIFFLLKTDKFSNLKYSILFGLSTGIAASMKPSFVIFLIAPLCIYLYKPFIKSRQLIKKQITLKKINNLIISIMICIAFATIWYLPNLKNILDHSMKSISLSWGTINHNFFYLPNVIYYFKTLTGVQILYYYSFLFFLSIVFLLFINKKNRFFLFSWFLVPYIFFTFFVLYNKNIAYTIPYLPAIALMISIFLLKIKKKPIKNILIVLTIFVGFSQFFIISYLPNQYYIFENINNKLDHYLGGVSTPLKSYISYNKEYGSFPPSMCEIGLLHAHKSDWGINNIMEIINNSLQSNHKEKPIKVEAFYEVISVPLKNIFELNNIENVYVEDSYRKDTHKSLDADYVILSNITLIERVCPPVLLENANIFVNKFRSMNGFVLIGEVLLPDKTKIKIYKNMKGR